MEEILIKINCNKTTCDKCFGVSRNKIHGTHCIVFSKKLKTKGDQLLRLLECKKARVKSE